MSDPPVHRILIVVSSLAVGGPQKSLIGLLQRIDADRFDVDLAILGGISAPMRQWVPSKISVIEVPPEVSAATFSQGGWLGSLRQLLPRLKPLTAVRLVPLLLHGVVQLGGRQRMRQRIWRAVRRDLRPIGGTYDAAFGILGLSTMAIVDLVDAPRKYHWIRSDTRILERDERIDGAYFEHLTGAVSVSETCAQIFEDMYPRFRRRIVVYKNDIPSIAVANDRPVIPSAGKGVTTLVTVTRLDPLKGIDIAIAACDELLRSGVQVRWIVVGDGAERENLEQMVRQRQLAEQFILWGHSDDVTGFLRVADIYVHPSRTEGRSNSVEEARACGLPIVATAYETVADQVDDGKTGVVCEISPAAITRAVAGLVANPQAAQRLGAAAAAAHLLEVDDPNLLFRQLALGDIEKAARSSRE